MLSDLLQAHPRVCPTKIPVRQIQDGRNDIVRRKSRVASVFVGTRTVQLRNAVRLDQRFDCLDNRAGLEHDSEIEHLLLLGHWKRLCGYRHGYDLI